PRLEDIGAVGETESGLDILLDEQDGHAAPVDLADDAEDRLDDTRRKTEGGLVEDQQARRGHQRASDRHHLLLAARARAGELAPPLAQDREDLVNPPAAATEPRARVGCEGAQVQTLVARHPAERPP